ncbi:MAG: glycerol-3-phosphate acyltransferase [Chloroflexi bacterium]|nr:MAG: glycerol-3-phosphate acyltransferase [Chloroflexota bacterium]MBL1193728.1 glycerol-3-phosphate acyltransferase [Chloroflexota bacterium]NOH11021.1 glycerol-3-phosphate acyltransferase [Chloroflexota bacterium]
MNVTLTALGFIVFGYALGSLPFSIWVTRLFIGTDVRDGGSGHATATNAIRQAGWVAGVVVFVLDIAKGFLPTYLASQYGDVAWVVPLTAAFAVAGHNWPVWAGFRGGMGLAVTGGSLLAVYPVGFFAGVGLLIALVLIIKHGARATFIGAFLFAPLMWLLGAEMQVVWQTAAISLVLAIRFATDWNRKYRELWLDRE